MLRYTAFGGAGLLAVGMTSCGTDDDSAPTAGSTTTARSLGPFRLQLNWFPTASFAPEYVALEHELYRAADFSDMELLYGGPNVATEAAVVSGKAHMGLADSISLAAAVMEGAPLVAVGTHFQRSPLCLVSLPDNPISTPDDLPGKRVGVSVIDESIWNVFLELTGVDPESIQKVPVADTDPAVLTSGQVDALMAWAHYQPLALDMAGHESVVLMLSDFGLANYDQLFVVTREELENHRDRALAGLKTLLVARSMLAENPQEGVDLSVEKYAADSGEDPELARRIVDTELDLQESDVTREKGRGYLDPDMVAASVETLTRAGLEISEDAYTTALLDEIYMDGPDISL